MLSDVGVYEGFKETEIGPIPVDWEVVRLGELCQLDRENVEPRGLPEMPYVGLEHIDSGEPKLRRWGSSNEVRSAKHHFVPGDVLYGKLRPYLDKAVLADSEGVCSTDILVFKANPDLTLPKFLAHLLHTQQFLSYAISTTTGTNLPRTRWTSLKGFELALPPLPEQRRIAHVLSTIQRAIAAQDALICAARELKRSLMRHLFTYGPVPLDQAEQVPLKETEIGPVLEHWEVAPLKDAATFTRKPKGLKLSEYETIPFIPMELISETSTQIDQYVPKPGNSIRSGTYCEKGDILLPKITPSFENGKQGIVGEIPLDFAYATTEVYPIRGKPDRLDQMFLFHFLQLPHVRADIAGKMEGSTGRQRVPKAVVEKYSVPLPSLPEQRCIARMLSTVDRKIEAEEQRKAALQTLFKTMLEQLMTGQVRLRDVEFEA
jgi:type I restriction enzyme S subunit